MYTDIPLICPVCNAGSFVLKHEASYVYSYHIDTENSLPGTNNNYEFLPFLYDNREQKNSRQYLECSRCGTRYPCYFDQVDGKVPYKTLQDAVNTNISQKSFSKKKRK